ncbi:EF-hand domain-containing protein [Maricaulis parjimensis]|uniref:EF-hand domain-containing protein n=1 Tax=Maricaulis parjimensis TaxID=144023 RepID=UPI001939CBC1|nr:EF-hand domain-containing protein [Maricaulis parjimensis]
MIASAFSGAALGAWALMALVQPVSTTDTQPLFGMQDFVRFDGNADRRLTRSEYFAADGSARSVLMAEGFGASWGALSTSVFHGTGLDIYRFRQAPETISQACWDAVEATRRAIQVHTFDGWDENGDGLVSAREFSEVRRAGHVAMFETMDRDQDGVVTRADYTVPQTPAMTARMMAVSEAAGTRPVLSDTACQAERALAPVERVSDPVRDTGSVLAQRARSASPQERTFVLFDLDLNGAITSEEFLGVVAGW